MYISTLIQYHIGKLKNIYACAQILKLTRPVRASIDKNSNRPYETDAEMIMYGMPATDGNNSMFKIIFTCGLKLQMGMVNHGYMVNHRAVPY